MVTPNLIDLRRPFCIIMIIINFFYIKDYKWSNFRVPLSIPLSFVWLASLTFSNVWIFKNGLRVGSFNLLLCFSVTPCALKKRENIKNKRKKSVRRKKKEKKNELLFFFYIQKIGMSSPVHTARTPPSWVCWPSTLLQLFLFCLFLIFMVIWIPPPPFLCSRYYTVVRLFFSYFFFFHLFWLFFSH